MLEAFKYVMTKLSFNQSHPAPAIDEPQPKRKKREFDQKTPQEKLIEIVSSLYGPYSEKGGRGISKPLSEELERFINVVIEENLIDSLDFNEKIIITKKSNENDVFDAIFSQLKSDMPSDDNYQTVLYCITDMASWLAEMARNDFMYIVLGKIMAVISFDHFAKINIVSRLRQLAHLHAKVKEPQVLEALLQKRPELYQTLCFDDNCLMSIARAVGQYNHPPATLILTLKAFSIEKCVADRIVYDSALGILIIAVEEEEVNHELYNVTKQFLVSYVTALEKINASNPTASQSRAIDTAKSYISMLEGVLKKHPKNAVSGSDASVLVSHEAPENGTPAKRMGL